MAHPRSMDPAELDRSLANLKLERDAIVLYDGLAGVERDPHRRAAFQAIAGNERRHAAIWADRLREMGASVPDAGPARLRIRFILLVARLFGTRSVSDLVQALEGDEEDLYDAQAGPEVAAIAADEREHAQIWKRLGAGLPAVGQAGAPGPGVGVARAGATVASAPAAASAAVPAVHGRSRDEAWHRGGRSGSLRAAIFGINDGLVSNLALVMGVAGASSEERFIILAGVAGLLAGAFSMAAGEWISMQSQRELFQRQIDLEREEMRIMPEVEQAELAAIYRAKGLPPDEAAMVAARLMEDPEHALDTKIREELGLDPDELGSASGAAGSSFVAFAAGAVVPLVPFLVLDGAAAIVASFGLAVAALFLVGAGVSLLTGRGLLFSGLRQVLIGSAAAVVTYLVGSLIGVQVAG